MHEFQQPVLDVAFATGGDDYRDALRDLIAWSERQPNLRAEEHQPAGEGEAQAVIKYIAKTGEASAPIFWAAYPHQRKIDLSFLRAHPFTDADARHDARTRLRTIPGANNTTFPPDQIGTLRLEALAYEGSRAAFHDVLDWALACVIATRSAPRAS